MDAERWPFTLKFEHDKATIVTCRKEIEIGVGGQNPEPIMLPPERLDRGPLREIPHAHGLVLPARHDQFMLRVEKRGGDIVKVAST